MYLNRHAPATIIKVYEEVRSAHFERLIENDYATQLFYRKASYDFEPGMESSRIAYQGSRLSIAGEVFRSDATIVELNEPLFVRALPLTVLCLAAARLRPLRGGKRPRIVTYAIENIDVVAKVAGHSALPERCVRPFLRAALSALISGFDKVAFGTDAARRAYVAVTGVLPRKLVSQVIPPLEPACQNCDLSRKATTVLFLGAFDERKGIDILMRAWPAVIKAVPEARLDIIGKGPREMSIAEWLKQKSGVRLNIDPPRKEIHRALSATKVLVLPSISSRYWREQVGLPILEGLSHGCSVVTTEDTGLADWLKNHGHRVLPNRHTAEDLSSSLIDALREERDALNITKDLPIISGRYAAEDWLCRS